MGSGALCCMAVQTSGILQKPNLELYIFPLAPHGIHLFFPGIGETCSTFNLVADRTSNV